MASGARDPGVRGGLLAAIGLLSLVASFSTFSLVSVVLLPATFVLWFAAARSLAASGRPLATSVPAAVVGLLIVATVALGFFALWGIQDDEDRCWVLSYDSDGQSRWESRPNVGGPGSLNPGPLSGGPAMVSHDGGVTWQREGPLVSSRGHCTSDIITDTEAALGMGAVIAASPGHAAPLTPAMAARRPSGQPAMRGTDPRAWFVKYEVDGRPDGYVWFTIRDSRLMRIIELMAATDDIPPTLSARPYSTNDSPTSPCPPRTWARSTCARCTMRDEWRKTRPARSPARTQCSPPSLCRGASIAGDSDTDCRSRHA